MGIHPRNVRQNSKYKQHLTEKFDAETEERSVPRQGLAAGLAVDVAALDVAAELAVESDGQGWFLEPPPPRR